MNAYSQYNISRGLGQQLVAASSQNRRSGDRATRFCDVPVCDLSTGYQCSYHRNQDLHQQRMQASLSTSVQELDAARTARGAAPIQQNQQNKSQHQVLVPNPLLFTPAAQRQDNSALQVQGMQQRLTRPITYSPPPRPPNVQGIQNPPPRQPRHYSPPSSHSGQYNPPSTNPPPSTTPRQYSSSTLHPRNQSPPSAYNGRLRNSYGHSSQFFSSSASTPNIQAYGQHRRGGSPVHSMDPNIILNASYSTGSTPYTPGGNGAPSSGQQSQSPQTPGFSGGNGAPSSGQQSQSPQAPGSNLTLSMLRTASSSPTTIDYSKLTVQELERNPNLFRAVMSQSYVFHGMLKDEADKMAQSNATASRTSATSNPAANNPNNPMHTTHPPHISSNSPTSAHHSQQSSPFRNTVNSLLSTNCSSVQVADHSPYVDTKMDTKTRKAIADKLEDLKRKIKGMCTNTEYIENNRDFLMAYEDISRYLQYAGLQPMVQDPTAAYNVDNADIMEAMITALFPSADAFSIIIQGKNATINKQPEPNNIPHPYYLWQAITEQFIINQRLFEELRTELNTLRWNGPEKIQDMRGLHAYVMMRAHLFQTPIAKQHSTTAMDNNQLFFALDNMLSDETSPYKQAWQEEHRKMLQLPFHEQMNKLLAFIRDNKTMESHSKSNARRKSIPKVPTLVSTSTSQQEQEEPYNLASSGGNILQEEFDTYLTDAVHADDDVEVPTLYASSHNHKQAYQHSKKMRYAKSNADTHFQHRQPIENNHPAAKFINQIPTKANYNPKIYQHNHQGQHQYPKHQYSQQYHQGQQLQAPSQETPNYTSNQQRPTYSSTANTPMHVQHHPTYITQPSQQQQSQFHESPTQVDTHEAFPLHYQHPPGYPPSYPSTPMYQYPPVQQQQQQHHQPYKQQPQQYAPHYAQVTVPPHYAQVTEVLRVCGHNSLAREVT